MKLSRFTTLLLIICATQLAATARTFSWINSTDGESVVYAWLPDSATATGRAIVDCPGGGYVHLAMEHEGSDWAPMFNDMGIAYFVVKYRMPQGDPRRPQDDVERAITTLRDSAEAWHINPYDIGVMGFSAGGHLASTIATHAPVGARPDFQILFYPVITGRAGTHAGSRSNFLGDKADDQQMIDLYSNERQVRRHAGLPAIIFLNSDDQVVTPVENGLAYYAALQRLDVPAEVHVFPDGGHGWGYRESFPYHEEMTDLLRTWLTRLPAPRPDAVRVACVGNSITDGYGLRRIDTESYPAVLQQMLGNGYLVKNFGVSSRTLMASGDRPYTNERAWTDCLGFSPDIVVLKLGTNDSKPHNWAHAECFEPDLQAMIDTLRTLPSSPRIYLCTPAKVWSEDHPINDSTITEAIIPAILRVAQRNGLPVIDIHSATDSDSSVFIADGIHPDAKGYRILATTVHDALVGTKKD